MLAKAAGKGVAPATVSSSQVAPVAPMAPIADVREDELTAAKPVVQPEAQLRSPKNDVVGHSSPSPPNRGAIVVADAANQADTNAESSDEEPAKEMDDILAAITPLMPAEVAEARRGSYRAWMSGLQQDGFQFMVRLMTFLPDMMARDQRQVERIGEFKVDAKEAENRTRKAERKLRPMEDDLLKLANVKNQLTKDLSDSQNAL